MDELDEQIRGIAFVSEDVKEEGVPLPIYEVPKRHTYGWEENQEQEHYLKLESLKLAYDTAYKVGGFHTMSTYMAQDSKVSLKEDVADVFKLADMNYRYIKGCS